MNSTYADLIETLQGTRSAFDQFRAQTVSRLLDRAALEQLYELTSLHARMARQLQQAMDDHRADKALRAEIESLAEFFEGRDTEFALRLQACRTNRVTPSAGIAAE